VDSHLRYNDNLHYCIRSAQSELDFEEEDFQFDSLKKYYVRNSKFYEKFCPSESPKNPSGF
jgi:hypothetical protein